MHNIREWFGNMVQYDASTDFNKGLDGLLNLFKEAMYMYLNYSQDVENVQLMLIKLTGKLEDSQKRFIEWFESKGLKQIQNLSQLTEVKNETQVLHEINYFYYLLEEEIICDQPDDLRSYLITVAIDLPLLIEEVESNETSASVENFETVGNLDFIIKEMLDWIVTEDKLQLLINEMHSYLVTDVYKNAKTVVLSENNYKEYIQEEPINKEASFLFKLGNI